MIIDDKVKTGFLWSYLVCPNLWQILGKDSEALAALTWLHGTDQKSIDYELANIRKALREKQQNKMTLSGLKEKSVLKPFLISFTMFVFLKLSGLNVMVFYCNAIFKYSGSSLSEKEASIVVGGVLLLSSFVALGAIVK